MKPRAPASFRDFLRGFAAFQPDEDLGAFFGRFDWSGAGPAQLCHALLDRPPKNAAEATAAPDFAPEAAARALFESPAFRDNLIARALAAFPNRRRVLFVHLPKCAGTDFEQVLRASLPLLHPVFESAEAMPAAALGGELARLARALPATDQIACGGHIALRTYLDGGLFRFADRLVAIARPPREIALSFANYVLARFHSEPALAALDTQLWGRALGIDHFDAAMSAPAMQAFARQVVTHPGLMPVNPLCTLLGDGTAAGAADQLARAAIEVTTVPLYDRWLHARWSGARSARVNAQQARVAWSDLAATQQQAVAAASQEDERLYAAILAAIGGGLFTTGPAIAARL